MKALILIWCLFVPASLLAQSNGASHKGASKNPDVLINGAPGHTPLMVIDGKIYRGILKNIDPNDIASITVLKKDAAISLYGPKASNGVLLIITKAYKEKTQQYQIQRQQQQMHQIYALDSIAGPNAKFVIDGNLIDHSLMVKDLNPYDVFDIHILKDTTTAIIPGGNKTIIITTKTSVIAAYINKLSAFSGDYKKHIEASHGDLYMQYILNGKVISGTDREIISELNNIPAESIKTVDCTELRPRINNFEFKVFITTI